MQVLGNLAYVHLSVAFIQMLKAGMPLLVLALLWLLDGTRPAGRVLLAVSGIAVGTAVASYGELRLSLFGLVVMWGSNFSEAFRVVALQRLLGGSGGGSSSSFSLLESLYYVSPACGALSAIIGQAVLFQ